MSENGNLEPGQDAGGEHLRETGIPGGTEASGRDPGSVAPREKARSLLLVVALVLASWFLLRGVIGLLVPPVAPHPAQELELKVIAHRGGKALFPENTMEAFESSLALGADALEMDMHLSADGIPVLIHDDDVYRTTSGEGLVSSLTVEDLRSLDAGYWWPAGRKEDCEACLQIPDEQFPYRGMGIRIPVLEDVLQRFPSVPKVIEIKENRPEAVRALGELLRRYRQQDLVIVGSFHKEALDLFRQEYPEFATSAAESEVLTFYIMNLLGFGSSYPSPAEFFQVPISSGRLRVITPGFLKTASESNIRVQAWTINDSSEMNMLLDMGIDGIITDDPAELLRILGRR